MITWARPSTTLADVLLQYQLPTMRTEHRVSGGRIIPRTCHRVDARVPVMSNSA